MLGVFWGVWLHTCICLVTGLLASVEVQVFTCVSSAPHGVFITVDVFKKMSQKMAPLFK